MLQQLGIFAQSKDKAGTKNHAKIPNIFDFIYRMNNRDPTIPKISRIKQKKKNQDCLRHFDSTRS